MLYILSNMIVRVQRFNCTYTVFSTGVPGTLGFRQHSPGVLPEAIQVLRSTVYFNSPVQIFEQGFLEPLECILGVPLLHKG